MALDGLLTSLRNKARSIGLSFSLAASVICGGSCGEAAKESDDSPQSCSYDRDCRRDEACIEQTCKSIDVGQYSLDGIVTDWTTGNPVDGVKVTIKKDRNTIRDTTDARGHFQLSQLSEGTYTITWEKGAYLTNKKSVQLLGADKTFDVELAPEDMRLNFSIEAFGVSYTRNTTSESHISDYVHYPGIYQQRSIWLDLGQRPDFIRNHVHPALRDSDGVLLQFTDEASVLQVSQEQRASFGTYREEEGKKLMRMGDFATARIPFEYYRFKPFEEKVGGGSHYGSLFYAKVWRVDGTFLFKCDLMNPEDEGWIDWPNNNVYRKGIREYCEIEEGRNERGSEWAKCLSDDCQAPLKIDEIDIYVYNGIGESY